MASFTLTVVNDDHVLLTTIQETALTITTTPAPSVTVSTVGVQGAPGPNNLFVGPVAPSNPPANAVWINTSGL